MGGRGLSENGGAQPKRLEPPGAAVYRIPAVSLSSRSSQMSPGRQFRIWCLENGVALGPLL